MPGAKFCRSAGFLGRGEGQCQGWDHCLGLSRPSHTHMHTPVEEKPPLRISKATGVYKLSYWQGECGPLSGDGAEKLTLPSVISQERGSGRLQRESRLTSHGQAASSQFPYSFWVTSDPIL